MKKDERKPAPTPRPAPEPLRKSPPPARAPERRDIPLKEGLDYDLPSPPPRKTP